ncbi:GH39 family glycosyl hydrolase, partial [Streptomyces viridosporus]|uniref:GH39 family glycosyl hydrolase n=1 Tax=Streptomyces viridosporus TaxID=67581 RepID=UPI00135925D4
LPLHITEFNSSYRPDNPIHDTAFHAAYLAPVLVNGGDLADSFMSSAASGGRTVETVVEEDFRCAG